MTLKIEKADIEAVVLDYINSKKEKTTPGEISALLQRTLNFNRKLQKEVIQNLIQENILEYSFEYGRSFIDVSFNRPVQVSDHIILTPPDQNIEANNGIVIQIEKGTSFGRGTHPTTRLMLQSMDDVLYKTKNRLSDTKGIDIGTGSGVLAIAGVMLGIGKMFACDIEPVSLSEAKRNAELNRVEKKIQFSTTIQDGEKLDFIFANLRYPTLIDLKSQIGTMIKKNGMIIFSGIQVEEKKLIYEKFSDGIFKPCFEKNEKGWSSIVFQVDGECC